MKKLTKQLLLTGAVLSVAGLVLFGAGAAAGGRDYVKDADLNVLNGAATMTSSDRHAVLERTEIDSFSRVNADLRNIDLMVQPSPDNKFYLSYNVETTNGVLPVTSQVSDGTLNLVESKGHSSYSYVHIDINFLQMMLGQSNVVENQNNVVLYIPADQTLDSFSCKMGDGELTVDSLNSRKFLVSSDYGDILLKNTSVEGSKISLTDGDLTGKNVTFKGSCSITSSLGDVSLSLPDDNLKDLSIKAATSLGDVSCPDSLKGTLTGDEDEDQQTYTLSSDSDDSLDITSEDGDITITAAK